MTSKRLSFIPQIILLFVLILFLSSCASWHCKKCLDSGELKADTVYQQFFVDVPSVKTDTVFKDVPGREVTITKDKLLIHYRRLPGDTVYIDGECLPDTVIVNVPTLVTNTVETGWRPMKVLGVGLLILVVLVLILRLVKFL